MRRGLRAIDARLLPRGWGDALRQLGLFALAYYGYQLTRGVADARVSTAAWNATKVIDLERRLHIFVEPAVQAWATGTGWLVAACSWAYVNCHLVISVGAIFFLYLRRNDSFYFVRNMFMLAMALALVGYILFPTAPPRLMPEWGFSDSVADTTGVREQSVAAFVNMYAAVPSMHVCFALMIGGTMAQLVRPRAPKALWLLYPAVVTFVVVATGNHFVLDAVAGAVVAAAAALGAQRLLARARPAVWAFHPVRAGAAA